MIARIIAWSALVSLRVLTRVHANGASHQPPPGQCIYIANHSSHLDVLLLLSVLPRTLWDRTRPVAAAEYWTAGPIRRWLIHSIFKGVLLGREKGGLNPLEPVAAALRYGDSLIFFPEGTRGPGGNLLPLKPGIFHIAKWFPGVDIIPVWIGNSRRLLPRLFAPVPLKCSIQFGAALRWRTGQKQEEFLAEARQALESLQSNLV